jgi:serine/threonine protein kinase/Tfp pilus assembly protein PilF
MALSSLFAELARAEPVAPPVDPYREGDRVGRFRLLREIGRGGFGMVFEALDEVLGRRVAFKALAPRLGQRSRPVDDLLLREAEAVARLTHPNIVVVHDFGRAEAGPYLIMELLPGESLQARLRRSRLSLAESMDLAVQMARGLESAHASGVLHRDLKPANVFLTRDGQVKLLDFGLALLGLAAGGAAGTPGYVAPEQWRGEPHGPSADVYGAAIILLEMLTGARPSQASEEGAAGRATRPGLEIPGAPPELALLLAAATDQDPRRRPTDGRAWLAELVAVRNGLEFPAAPVPVALAVLPFAEHGVDGGVADGLLEVLLSRLSRVTALRVTARSTSLAYRDTRKPPAVLGTELGVQLVLAGGLARRGPTIQVFAELLDTASSSLRWSGTWSLSPSDPYDGLEAIGEEVAQGLVERLAAEDRRRVPGARGAASQALASYLRGQFLLAIRTPASFQAALAEFRAAEAVDPSYAAPHVGMAYVHIMSGIYGFEPPIQAFSRATAHVDGALARDVDSGEALGAKAAVQLFHERTFEEAERTARRALALNPSFGFTRLVLADVLWTLGRGEEALQQIRSAVRLDPVDRGMNMNLGEFLNLADRHDEAILVLERLIELDAGFVPGRARLAKALAFGGRHPEAAEVLSTLRAGAPEPVLLDAAAVVHGLAGARAGAREALAGLERLAGAGRAVGWSLAQGWAAVGDADAAAAWLGRALEAGEPSVVMAHQFPTTRAIRTAPAMASVLERIGIPGHARA